MAEKFVGVVIFVLDGRTRMTQADLDKVSKLGIKTQIDLRRSDEIRNQTRGPLEDMGARYAWHPVYQMCMGR